MSPLLHGKFGIQIFKCLIVDTFVFSYLFLLLKFLFLLLNILPKNLKNWLRWSKILDRKNKTGEYCCYMYLLTREKKNLWFILLLQHYLIILCTQCSFEKRTAVFVTTFNNAKMCKLRREKNNPSKTKLKINIFGYKEIYNLLLSSMIFFNLLKQRIFKHTGTEIW